MKLHKLILKINAFVFVLFLVLFYFALLNSSVLSSEKNTENIETNKTNTLARDNQIEDINNYLNGLNTLANFKIKQEQQQKEQEIIERKQKSCTGTWIHIPSLGINLSLGYINIDDWKWESEQSILNETKNNPNVVLLGHNKCAYGDCLRPHSSFAKIINAQIGEYAEMCQNNKLYGGKIIVSKAIPDTATYILGNWLGKDTVTMFTCYGECMDANCSYTNQRWALAFERNIILN